ncbi:hypothetical protein [Promicromonospora kroppenstedtii]|uniref:hypothetical protein n=1 Tax=Promicromonospora kroppenstedtii TaxID=440482 RepID=UPI0004AD2E20|nr:hypothetical protein [Promicromonospora kroppenstedtii]
MSELRANGKARIVGNSNPRHPFSPGVVVTLRSRATSGVWYVYGKHPNKLVPQPLYHHVAEEDLEPVEDEPIYSEAQAAAVDAEAEWFDGLPKALAPEPVKVLGDFYTLATDEAIESALRNLRFELATREKEATT